jgi:hypothetical protein
MSDAVEILSRKGLQLALQQQPILAATNELPDYVTSRQGKRHAQPRHFIYVLSSRSCFGAVSPAAAACLRQLHHFIQTLARPGEREWIAHVAPTCPNRWQPVPVIERLKLQAKVHARNNLRWNDLTYLL